MKGWIGSAVAAMAAVVTFLIVPATDLPGPVVKLVCGWDTTPMDLQGGARLTLESKWTPTEAELWETEQVLEEKVAPWARHAEVRRRGRTLTIDLAGAHEDAVPTLESALTTQVRFQMREVYEGTEFARRLYQHAESDPRAAELGITAETDYWRAPDYEPEAYVDHYLVAPRQTRFLPVDEARRLGCYAEGSVIGGETECVVTGAMVLREYVGEILAARAELSLPEDRELAFERLRPLYGEEDQQTLHRSYVVARDPVLTHGDISRAEVVWNPTTNKPEVLVTFTARGADRFAELTRRVTGRKIAILIGDEISSAPVVQGEITGGQSTITMGAASPAGAQEEAEALAAALRAGSLPMPLVLSAPSRHLEPTVSRARMLAARGLFAFLVGLIALALVGIGRRVAGPVDGDEPAFPAARQVGATTLTQVPWFRLLVTLGAPALVVVAHQIALPTLDRNTLASQGAPYALFDLFSLGLTPVLLAYVLVELFASCVPRLRRYRLGGREGRSRLGPPVAVLTLVIAGLHASSITWYLMQIGLLRDDVPLMPVVTVLTLVAACFVLVVLARLVDRFGLGNGFSILLLADLYVQARGIERQLDAAGPAPAMVLLGVLGIAALVLLTVWILRRRPARDGLPALPAPTSGAVPLFAAFWLTTLFIQVSYVLSASPGWLAHLYPQSPAMLAVHIALAVGLGAAFAALFARPALWREPAGRLLGERIGPEAARDAFVRATAYSLAFLVAVLVGYTLLGWKIPPVTFELPALIIAVAVIRDLRTEWHARTRHPDLVPVWPLHRVPLAPHVRKALADRGIDCHLRGLGHRSMLHLFGPYVPIDVMVPAARADEARELLAETLPPR